MAPPKKTTLRGGPRPGSGRKPVVGDGEVRKPVTYRVSRVEDDAIRTLLTRLRFLDTSRDDEFLG